MMRLLQGPGGRSALGGHRVHGLPGGLRRPAWALAAAVLVAAGLALAPAAVAQTVPAKPVVGTSTTGDGQVTLKWTAIAGVTGWQYWQGHGPSGIGDWFDISGSGASTAQHTVTGLANGVVHDFRVRAKNATGFSPASDLISLRPQSATGTAPGAVTGVSATAGDGQVLLGWTRISGATDYEYQQKQGSGGTYGSWTPMRVHGLSQNFLVVGLTNGTLYGFKVRAVNARGTGTASSEVTATPAVPTTSGLPAKPAVTATAGNRQVTLNWAADSTATNWEYQYQAEVGGWGRWLTTNVSNPGTITSYTVQALSNGTAYMFRVRAVNSTGTGPASDAASATPAAPTTTPVKPTGVTAEARGATGVRLEWPDRRGEAGQSTYVYENVAEWQYRYKTTGGTYGSWTGTGRGGTDTGHTVRGLTASTAYTFEVRGRNAAYTAGPASDEATATTTALGGL